MQLSKEDYFKSSLIITIDGKGTTKIYKDRHDSIGDVLW